MKTYETQNAERTRKAVAQGRTVKFSRRKLSRERYSSPTQFWKETYDDHAAACAAADAWVKEGKVLRKRLAGVSKP